MGQTNKKEEKKEVLKERVTSGKKKKPAQCPQNTNRNKSGGKEKGRRKQFLRES